MSGLTRTLTEQQARATRTRKCSVVLSSGAGCGKTSVLTERYLSHLEAGEADVGQLVAITFTDRAAREMRKRIRTHIENRIQKSTGEERECWQTQLVGLETATIGTIHSFCGTLLRRHALTIGLDPGFEVLDSAVTSNLRATAVRDALAELVLDSSATGEALCTLIELYGWPATRSAIAKLIEAKDFSRDLAVTAKEIAERWQNAAGGELLNDYVQHLTTGGSSIARCLRLLRQHQCTGPKMLSRIKFILDELPNLASAKDLSAAVAQLSEAAKVQGTEAAKAWASAEVYDVIKDALQKLREQLPDKLAFFTTTPEKTVEAAQMGQQFLSVTNSCRNAYDRAKERAGGLDFDDLLIRARDLLRYRPDVRTACQYRIQFLLVDELQDTDPVQMEIVELLCGSGLAKGKLFAVGDAKQSIYRFRGAEVKLFDELRGKVSEDGRQSLSVNFRSQPPILSFVNAVLSEHMTNYEPLEPALERVGKHGCVEFLWGAAFKKDVEQSRHTEAIRIAKRIAAMVVGKEKLVTDRGQRPSLRPVRPGDVVLLFRAMTNVAIYESALREAGLDFYVVGGRAFYAQQEIYDLANLLRTLENPNHSIALAGVLRSSFGCLSDDALVLLTTHAKGLWAGLHDPATRERLPVDDRAAAERIAGWLLEWRRLKDRLSTSSLLQKVLADSGFDAALRFEFLGERKLANLWKLIEHARVFDRPGRRGLHDFLQELDRLIEDQPREEQAATQPEESDVVRIMSIHQAKGLEFPIVFLPNLAGDTRGPEAGTCMWDRELGPIPKPPADDDPPPFSDYAVKLWQIRETLADWHEDLRTFYVACTRAKDYLVLSGSLPEPFVPTNTAMTVLSERFDLVNGDCRDSSMTGRPEVSVYQQGAEPGRLSDRPSFVSRPLTAADAKAIAMIPAPAPTPH